VTSAVGVHRQVEFLCSLTRGTHTRDKSLAYKSHLQLMHCNCRL